MLFKHPKVLYALLALLIPILIHLFKLRKFKKTAFTNVAFLEKIRLQTRKSSQLKKWLVLGSRLLLLTGLIFAFAEPYFPSSSKKQQPEKYIIYLDNSFSMQAKGENGPLLKRAIQELIEQINENQIITLFTNNEVFKNIRISEAQNELMDIDYVAEQLSPDQLSLKFKQLSKGNKNQAFIAISDFQKLTNASYSDLDKFAVDVIKLTPQQFQNVVIDSLHLKNKNNELILEILASSNQFKQNLPLSVFNGTNLIGKAELNFSETNTQKIEIPLPKNTNINGYVQTVSPGLTYDNTRYFSVNTPPKTAILAIGSPNNNRFLQKIYTSKEFIFKGTSLANLNYADISTSNCIIINEVNELSSALKQNLISFTNQGGILVVIPAKGDDNKLENFLKSSYNIEFRNRNSAEKKVTQISFEHPIFKNVFSKQIKNFQYPTVKENYQIKNAQKVLGLEDNTIFLAQKNNVYIFSAPLNEQTTNFKKSPLIVPCFFNIAKQNTPTSQISYSINQPNDININITDQNQDKVLHIKNDLEQFIPLQQLYKNYVKISTTNLPHKAGNYVVTSNDSIISYISYNYPTNESNLVYDDLSTFKNNKPNTSVTTYFSNAKASFKIKELWKWFLIFALAFLAIELLLLKFLK
ncbi:BatA domain-containing protein [Aquimarina agarivorans]|uniref:BatA domain-containing protein n=1 Tax=Aquimarina agarivorans TaxID=980584 RepID=UPI000248FC80|nr:BatA domain-containing protein [Aquimarina agarivorans]